MFPQQNFQKWLQHCADRLSLETRSNEQRQQAMKQVNPKFILRNYLLQAAIEKAQQKDFSEIDRLMQIIRTPFDEHPEYED